MAGMIIQQSTAAAGKSNVVSTSFARGPSSGSGTTGDASVTAEAKAKKNKIQEKPNYVLSMMRVPTIPSASEATDETAGHCSPPNLIHATDGEPGTLAVLEGTTITAKPHPSSASSPTASGDGGPPHEHDDNALKKSPPALRVLANTLIDLCAALKKETPHDSVMALLEAYRT